METPPPRGCPQTHTPPSQGLTWTILQAALWRSSQAPPPPRKSEQNTAPSGNAQLLASAFLVGLCWKQAVLEPGSPPPLAPVPGVREPQGLQQGRCRRPGKKRFLGVLGPECLRSKVALSEWSSVLNGGGGNPQHETPPLQESSRQETAGERAQCLFLTQGEPVGRCCSAPFLPGQVRGEEGEERGRAWEHQPGHLADKQT